MSYSFKGKGDICLSYKLDFPCSNNEAKYNVLKLGFLKALRRGICSLCIKGDSFLVVQQVNGEYTLKHLSLVPYKTAIQRLIN